MNCIFTLNYYGHYKCIKVRGIFMNGIACYMQSSTFDMNHIQLYSVRLKTLNQFFINVYSSIKLSHSSI